MHADAVATLPSDPENMNDLRAQSADSILVTFALQQGDESTVTIPALSADDDDDDEDKELVTIPAFSADDEDEETVIISGLSVAPEVDLQTLSDLLCQFGHWCDRNGFQLAEALKIAAMRYSDETGGQGSQFSA